MSVFERTRAFSDNSPADDESNAIIISGRDSFHFAKLVARITFAS